MIERISEVQWVGKDIFFAEYEGKLILTRQEKEVEVHDGKTVLCKVPTQKVKSSLYRGTFSVMHAAHNGQDARVMLKDNDTHARYFMSTSSLVELMRTQTIDIKWDGVLTFEFIVVWNRHFSIDLVPYSAKIEEKGKAAVEAKKQLSEAVVEPGSYFMQYKNKVVYMWVGTIVKQSRSYDRAPAPQYPNTGIAMTEKVHLYLQIDENKEHAERYWKYYIHKEVKSKWKFIPEGKLSEEELTAVLEDIKDTKRHTAERSKEVGRIPLDFIPKKKK